MSELVSDAPESEVVGVAPFAETSECGIGTFRAGKHAGGCGPCELPVLGFGCISGNFLYESHHFAFAVDDVVVDGGKLNALAGAALLEDAYGSGHLHAPASDVEDVALGVGEEFLPVFVGVAAFEVEVSVLGRHGEVHPDVRCRLPVFGIVVDVSVSACGGGNDVCTVGEDIVARGLEVIALSEAVDAEDGVVFFGSFDEDGQCLSLLEVDASGVFVGAVGVGVLQFAAECPYGFVGFEFSYAVFCGVFSRKHIGNELADEGMLNLRCLFGIHAVGKFGAEFVLEIFVNEVREF